MYSQVIEKFWYTSPFTASEKPEWITTFLQTNKIHFIKSQRLLKVDYTAARRRHNEPPSISEVIQIYSEEIKGFFDRKLTEQATVSHTLSRSFPHRLISSTVDQRITDTDIREQYALNEEKMQRLSDAGLLEKQETIELSKEDFKPEHRQILSLYLQDVMETLAVFDEFQAKLEIFLDIINKKFRTKSFAVNRDKGFIIKTVGPTESELSPIQLSSGEQHQIVLFYELIFKADGSAVFLVDEPEISLHIDWQRQFFDDIKRIAELGDRQFLIATHSPQIIGNHRNLAVALNEGILDE